LGAALHADDDQAAVDGEGVEVAVEVLGADDVEDDVRAASGGVFAQFLDEVLFAVVDQDVGAQGAAGFEFVRAAGGDRDLRADGLAELDRHRADAAAAAVHQQRLTGPQESDLEHVRPWASTPMDPWAYGRYPGNEMAVYLAYGRSDYIPPNS